MLVEYFIFETRQTSVVDLDLEKEPEYYDTREGTVELNRKVSMVTGLPVGSFKLGRMK